MIFVQLFWVSSHPGPFLFILLLHSKCLPVMPKPKVTIEAMQAIAERSREDYICKRSEEEALQLVEVSCKYLGVVQEDGTYDCLMNLSFPCTK